ncbi:dihydroorotate oxidase electron transfer subunit [Amycolatopsis rhabdoformis]|uniref:Dihydroorotate oxidase electron transfer subunit n=1 Tax=Amycolatopsis rhabdoformis TaxID=1448059 RepID=A0ABZ1IBI9_9PSEU|nr:dihydroorotate oxidase electron transfer subunit [Amycolatopsis rhabdoformis]WSE31790.1 dihydroorotate oxidase electron transfer subunit [Amycolatopsis rhabdoformis]
MTTTETRAVRDHVTPLPAGSDTRPAPTWHHAEILEHRPEADRYQYLRLHAPTIARTAAAGQFVMLTAARQDERGPVLPRPMAIYRRDAEAGTIEVVYGVVGDGTRKLTTFGAGETMLVVGPLGRGFHVPADTGRVLLVGRGIGTCSLTTVAEDLAGSATKLVAVASGRTPEAVIGAGFYRECGAEQVITVTDAEATSGVEHLRELLTSTLDSEPPQRILTCGSDRLAWLCHELAERWGAEVQVSLEAHMACGLGYCHGCATGTRSGPVESPLICKDGPVFRLAATS